MKLPNSAKAIIKNTKVTNYLLSLTHPEGKSKAIFFRKIGYNETNIERFKADLLKIGKFNDISKVNSEKEKIVIKYEIQGVLNAPNGKKYNIKTVWAIDAGSKIPHLITAHRDR